MKEVKSIDWGKAISSDEVETVEDSLKAIRVLSMAMYLYGEVSADEDNRLGYRGLNDLCDMALKELSAVKQGADYSFKKLHELREVLEGGKR